MAATEHASYMGHAFRTTAELVEEAKEVFAGIKLKPDTLVGRGMSGALVVPRLADALGLAWLIVRKPGDGSHSYLMCEGTLGARWLFVDDLIDSGATWLATDKAVDGFARRWQAKTRNVGAYLYEDGEYLTTAALRKRAA